MADIFIGISGNWGVPQDEADIIITDLTFDYSNQEKVVIKLSGLVKKTCPFASIKCAPWPEV